jgi:CubicO group peptidase (beta-lactamase class C family)
MADSKLHETIVSSLDRVTNDESTGVASLVFVAVDKHGKEIAAHASGSIGLDNKDKVTAETVFWIASCTKLLTVIACLQKVEQGLLKLDDHQQIYELCPELQAVKVLRDDGSFAEKKREITLRMLLSHTAGFGYEL